MVELSNALQKSNEYLTSQFLYKKNFVIIISVIIFILTIILFVLLFYLMIWFSHYIMLDSNQKSSSTLTSTLFHPNEQLPNGWIRAKDT